MRLVPRTGGRGGAVGTGGYHDRVRGSVACKGVVAMAAVTAVLWPLGVTPQPAFAVTVPVADVFVIDVPLDEGSAVARFEGAIHGAYRVDGGTVVYWSLREAQGSTVGLSTALEYEDLDLVGGVLADPGELDVLLPLKDEAGVCLCTEAATLPGDLDDTRFQTMYTTFPALPDGTATIDIDVDGRGTIVAGVPVDGALPGGPQVDATATLMGYGWPAAPREDVIEAATGGDPQDLVGRSTGQDGSVTTEGTGEDRLVRFDADVLFAFDRADLDGPAEEVLDDAVAALVEAGATRVEIIGHTDGQGTAAANQDLSVRRAQTVADVLEGQLDGDVEVTVEGRGWDEPIATNDTEEGRAKNRRVTISYSSEDER